MKHLIILLIGLCILSACNQTEEGVTEGQVLTPTDYNELHRPQFHFSPDSMWMNDPNGMVFYDGEYHLFYQYYPDSTVWGPMHWGHAISEDLVHWEHLPIALYPDQLGLIFSGSAVIDWGNTSGLGTDNQPPMIAIFTQHLMEGEQSGRNDFQVQSIAYSLDKGRNWNMYEGNPVIPNPGIRDFRDPKVIWHEESQKWVMVFAAGDHIKFYSSPNLIDWQHESDFGKEIGAHGGVWECPDLFQLTVENTRDHQLWTLLVSINPGGPNGGSATQYFLGRFDGKQFTLQNEFELALEQDTAIWLDYGRDNYAGVTWSDIPQEDGRRIFIGWMSNWSYARDVPTDRWRSAMTIPRELKLRDTENGVRLFSVPIGELHQLRKESKKIAPQTVEGQLNITALLDSLSGLYEVDLNLRWSEKKAPKSIYLKLSNSKTEEYTTGYHIANHQFFSDRTQSGKLDLSPDFPSRNIAPGRPNSTKVRLQVYFDLASAELFANGGQTVFTDIFFPNEDFKQLDLVVEGGSVEIVRGQIYSLDRIW
jgi:fructan beta-fructosidase